MAVQILFEMLMFSVDVLQLLIFNFDPEDNNHVIVAFKCILIFFLSIVSLSSIGGGVEETVVDMKSPLFWTS